MNFIDLFSGCGGLSLGLLNAGLNGLFAIEKNADAFATLKKNLIDNTPYNEKIFKWDSSILPISSHDIKEIISNDIYLKYLKELSERKLVDIIVGGPPCQGFSLAGKRNPQDPRNKLADAYLRVVEIIRPNFILMENVKGISLKFDKKGTEISTAEKIKSTLRDLGYIAISFLENSMSWGVPQSRTRFILLGIKKELFTNLEDIKEIEDKLLTLVLNDIGEFSTLFKKKKNLPPTVSTEDAISDLKTFIASEIRKDTIIATDAPGVRFKQLKYSVHNSSLTDYQKLMRGKLKNSTYIAGGLRLANHSLPVQHRFKKILNDINSEEKSKKYNISSGVNLPKKYITEQLSTRKHTLFVLNKMKVSATITTLPDDLLHYDEPRILTVRECARLQSFPDWYEFTGPYTTGGERRKLSCPKYTQVGNAVPPLMAEGIGSFISIRLPELIKILNYT
ncbi:DNA (cytosine-5-)-methyltransferase [Serratia fonticola]|uniref:DNA cytosine methyltransferase n=1 Tax=Serratia fonticola TaxID=47917 RepID=UPI000BFDDE5C|nr:DNA cytosine methyltransferase [Serratia fonticola]ATM77388.1 DNA (cytosine-5-)-methyltransferase [Serratia fonticola]